MEKFDNTKKYFESQQPDEKIILLIRRHLLAILPYIAIASFVYLVGLLMIFVFPFVIPGLTNGFAYNIYVLAVSLLFFFNTAFLFHNWILHYLHVAILTDDHFVEIEQKGMFARKVSQMTMDKIQDVSSSQKGIVTTMFNIGTVDVQTAGDLPNFVIEMVPNPNAISQRIMQIEEEYCERFGLRTDGLSKNANVTERVANGNSQAQQTENYNEPTIEYPTEDPPS